MGNEAHIHATSSIHGSDQILGTKTVAYRPNPFDAHLLLEILDRGLDQGLYLLDSVRFPRVLSGHPGHEIEIPRPVDGDWIAMKQIRHDGEVSIAGELIGYQLRIVEFVSNDVAEEEDGRILVGRRIGRRCNVSLG